MHSSIRDELRHRSLNVSLEVEFYTEIESVEIKHFHDAVLKALKGLPWKDGSHRETWGNINSIRLQHVKDLPVTRLYSPSFLEAVFNWKNDPPEWDGIIAEVESPPRFLVKHVRSSRCIKWKSLSKEASIKKARGVTSLWAKATEQIPPGEMGIIYICYPEVNRIDIADDRTQNIQESLEKWFHRWGIIVPLVMVNRIYPRPLEAGLPDLIENTLVIEMPDLDSGLSDKYPSNVFVPNADGYRFD